MSRLTKKQKDLLRHAYNIIDRRSRWTQGANARDKHDMVVEPKSPSAVCWCIAGAVQKARHDLKLTNHDMWKVIDVLTEATPQTRDRGTRFVSDVNDEEGYTAVRALVRKVLNA